MSEKNPFEVRLEVLKLANEIVKNNFNEISDSEKTFARLRNEQVLSSTPMSVVYNADTVLGEAEKLYDFVKRK